MSLIRLPWYVAAVLLLLACGYALAVLGLALCSPPPLPGDAWWVWTTRLHQAAAIAFGNEPRCFLRDASGQWSLRLASWSGPAALVLIALAALWEIAGRRVRREIRRRRGGHAILAGEPGEIESLASGKMPIAFVMRNRAAALALGRPFADVSILGDRRRASRSAAAARRAEGGVHCGGDRQRPCQWRTRRGGAERRGQGGGPRASRERIGAGAEERRPAACRGEKQPRPDGDQPAPDPGAPGAASGDARTLPRRGGSPRPYCHLRRRPDDAGDGGPYGPAGLWPRQCRSAAFDHSHRTQRFRGRRAGAAASLPRPWRWSPRSPMATMPLRSIGQSRPLRLPGRRSPPCTAAARKKQRRSHSHCGWSAFSSISAFRSRRSSFMTAVPTRLAIPAWSASRAPRT